MYYNRVFSGAVPTTRNVRGPVVVHSTVRVGDGTLQICAVRVGYAMVHKILNKVWEGNLLEISMIINPNVKVRVWLQEFVSKG